MCDDDNEVNDEMLMTILTDVNTTEVNAFPNGHLVLIYHPPNVYFMNHVYFLFQWDMILTIVMFLNISYF